MSFEQLSAQYMKRIAAFRSPYALSYVRKDYQEGSWLLLPEKDLAEWIRKQGTADLHQGIQKYAAHAVPTEKQPQPVHFGDVFLDFDDNASGEKARKDVIKLIGFWQQAFGRLEPTVIRIWYSGSKGFHVKINASALAMLPSENFYEKVGMVAAYLCSEADLDTNDFQIYAKRHCLRLPQTRRTKLRLFADGTYCPQFKIELAPHEIQQLSMDDIRLIAREPNTPRCSEEDWGKVEPQACFSEMMREVSRRHAEKKEVVEKIQVDTRLAIREEDKGKYPVCIQALLKYHFPKDGRRNRAMLNIIGFLKDAGYTQEDAIQLLDAWTRGIPWDTKKMPERLRSIKPNVLMAYGHQDSSYNFSCRKILSINTNAPKNEDLVPCAGKACSFVKAEQITAQDVSPTITFSEAITHTEGTYQVEFLLEEYLGNPYMVPTAVRAKCTAQPNFEETQKDHCVFCRHFHHADNAIQKPGEDEPLERVVRLHPERGEILSFVDMEEKKKTKHFKELMGIPRDCFEVTFTEVARKNLQFVQIGSIQTVRNDYAESEKEFSGDPRMTHKAFMFLRPNQQIHDLSYPMKGTLIPTRDPKSQHTVCMIKEMKYNDLTLHGFSMQPSIARLLREVHAVREGETLRDRLQKRVEAMHRITRLVDREEILMLMDMVYHSPLHLTHGNRRERGYMQAMILGDPGQGKSAAILGMANHFDLGSIIDGANIRRTGLLYSMQASSSKTGHTVRWGLLPRAHQQLVAIEECGQLDQEILEIMTHVRSSGILSVTGIAEASRPCEVRTIYLGNPSSARGRLDNYSYGIDAFRHMIKRDQDLRRFDLLGLIPSRQVDMHAAHALPPETHYTGYACQQLILWSWTRRAEQIVWSQVAARRVRDAGERLSKKYQCDMAFVDQTDMTHRLGRMTQAIAAMVFSSDAEGEMLFILQEHVEEAERILDLMLSSWGGMRLDTYSRMWQIENQVTQEQLTFLDKDLALQSWFPIFCRLLVRENHITPTALAEDIKRHGGDPNQYIDFLRLHGFLVSYRGTKELTPGPKFRRWLTERLELLISAS